jgi:hypothetical protein
MMLVERMAYVREMKRVSIAALEDTSAYSVKRRLNPFLFLYTSSVSF